MISLIYLLLALSFSLLLLHHLYTRLQLQRKHAKFVSQNHCLPPTTAVVPFPGNIGHKFHLLRQTYGDLFNDYYPDRFRRLGSTYAITDSLGRPKVVHTLDAINVRSTLLHNHDDWASFASRRNALKPFAQEGILTMDGHQWLMNRKIIFRRLNTRRARDTSTIEAHLGKLFHGMRGSPGAVTDLTELFKRMTIDLTSEYMLGVSIGLQDSVSGVKGRSEWQTRVDSFMESWSVIQRYVALRGVMGSRYWLVDGLKYRRACANFRSFFDAYIAKVESELEDTRNDTAEKKELPLVHELLSEYQGDRNKVREIIIELLIAGQNMIAATLEWTIAELAAHPEVYAHLRSEVLETFGAEGEDKRPLTWDALQTCRTLQNIIHETLRVHPLVPVLQRTAIRDTVLPAGGGPDGRAPVAVPKGASLTCNVYLYHRLPEVWGEDAWEWKPGRWEGRKMPVDYVPFGAGPRVCVGRQVSLTEISYVLARFAQSFERLEGVGDLRHKYQGILVPKEGVGVVVRRAGEGSEGK